MRSACFSRPVATGPATNTETEPLSLRTWQAANATVWNGPHLCRAACKTGSKQDPAHCSLAAGSAYAFDILKELDLV